MTTEEMIEALTLSQNKLVRRICTDITEKRDTIEHQKTVCGKFLQKVFEGNTEDAFRVADHGNKHAFLRWLIANDREDEANKLLAQNFNRDIQYPKE